MRVPLTFLVHVCTIMDHYHLVHPYKYSNHIQRFNYMHLLTLGGEESFLSHDCFQFIQKQKCPKYGFYLLAQFFSAFCIINVGFFLEIVKYLKLVLIFHNTLLFVAFIHVFTTSKHSIAI